MQNPGDYGFVCQTRKITTLLQETEPPSKGRCEFQAGAENEEGGLEIQTTLCVKQQGGPLLAAQRRSDNAFHVPVINFFLHQGFERFLTAIGVCAPEMYQTAVALEAESG